jgi:hypothetical protein
MKNYSTDLVNLLASKVRLYKVHLFKIGPTLNGQFIYATDGGEHIVFNGQKYEASKFGMWERDSITTKIGFESSQCKLTVFCDNRLLVDFPGLNNVQMLDGFKKGLLGGAPVTIYCAYMPVYGQVTGPTGGSLVETKFVGMVTSIESLGFTKAEIQLQDMMYLLNIQVPRMIFQSSCSNVLYDAKCTLAAANFTVSGSIGGVINNVSFYPASPYLSTRSAAGTFTQGKLTWTSGNNNGLTAFVLACGGTPQILTLDVQPIFPMQNNDNFKVAEGCDKSLNSCLNLQPTINPTSHLAMAYHNFAGQPYTPVPETAI